MTTFIFAVLLALIMLYAVTIEKVYRQVAYNEVRRQARKGNESARLIYQPLSYEITLKIFLWFVIIITAAGSFVLFTTLTSAWGAFILIVAILGMAFWWLPTTKAGSFSNLLARWSTRPLNAILHYLYPVIRPFSDLISHYYPSHIHTGLYEKEDLLELLKWQVKQSDNRILPDELTAAEQALKFNDYLVGDIITPRRKIYMVSAADTVGPLLMDDLHKSGHQGFPVYEGKKSHVVGVLYLQDLLKVQSGGAVIKYMHPDVQYLHEGYSLRQALRALFHSNSRLFIVINDHAEFVGVVTAEDILRQVIGDLDYDGFDAYDNPQAVANSTKQFKKDEIADSEPPEMV
jgi:CBS domain containing-hemolysin-like protein